MIVEFIGTPGAGKTTMLPVVTAYCAEHGIRARTVVDAARPYARRTLPGAVIDRIIPARLRRPLLWQAFYQVSTLYRLRFCMRQRRLIGHVLRAQLRRPIPIEERRHALGWFFVLSGQYEFLKSRAYPSEWLLFDEGFVHRAVQMHASDRETPDSARIAAYVDLLPRPDLVIAVRAPWELCVERIYRRGLWQRFRHKSRTQIERFVANAAQIVDLAVERISDRGWPLITIDNTGDTPACAARELRAKLTPGLSER